MIETANAGEKQSLRRDSGLGILFRIFNSRDRCGTPGEEVGSVDGHVALTEAFPVGHFFHGLAGRTLASSPWQPITIGHDGD